LSVFIKLVLIVLLLLLIFAIGIGSLMRIFLGALRGLSPSRGRGGRSSSRTGRFGNEDKAEHMLACSACGVHVPESEGITVEGKFFCCEAHRK